MKKEQSVTLLRYVRTSSGWTRRTVPTGSTRGWEQRMDRDLAAFGPDVIDLGEYQIRWYEQSKTRYESGGTTYVAARQACAERANRLNLIRAAVSAGIEVAMPSESKPLADRLEPFLESRMAKKKITSEDTCRIYRLAVGEFLSVTKVRYVEQVKERTLVNFLSALHKRGLADQTQANMFARVGTFLRSCSEGLGKMISEYAPKVAAKNPVCYTEEEVGAVLAFLRSRPRYKKLALVWEMYWKTGLRDKELGFLTWDLVDLKTGNMIIRDNRPFTLQVKGRAKTVVFRTKTRRDRKVGIPLETGLLDRLREWRESHPKDRFLFPTWNGNPDQTFLAKIRVALCHAGLNCGTCSACQHPCGRCRQCRCRQCPQCRKRQRCIHPHRGEKPCTRVVCEKWKLHRLRHSFATHFVRKNGDLAMLKDFLGHNKLDTTQKYISAAKEAEAKVAINRVFGI
jgi:site-specific recombinase XerD